METDYVAGVDSETAFAAVAVKSRMRSRQKMFPEQGRNARLDVTSVRCHGRARVTCITEMRFLRT
jgi:hypothetical protein